MSIDSIAPTARPVWRRDLAVIVAMLAVAAIVFVGTDTSEAFHDFIERHENWEFDELLLVLLTALVLVIWFAWRRQREANRHLAEQRRLLRRFDTIFASSPDAMTIDDADQKTVYVNDRFYELFELDKDAALAAGDPIAYALQKQAEAGAYGAGDPVALAKVRRNDVARQVRANGQVVYERQLANGRWYEARLIDLDGRGWVSIYRDFTDRRRIEDDLAAYRRRLSAILSNARQGFWFVDIDGITTDVNPGMCALLDTTREEMLGQPAFDFFDDENKAIVREQLALRRRGRTDPYEVTLKRADGTTVPCINAPVPIHDEDGRQTGSVGLWTDISERKAAEQALALSEANLKQAQRIAKLGNWSIDLTTGNLDWSDGMYDIFGHHVSGSADPRRDYLENIVHPEDLPALLQAQQMSITTGMPGSVDHRFRRPDGTIGWVHLEGLVEFEESKPVRLHGTAQEVTAAKEAELALRDLNETLEQRAAERAELLVAREQRYRAMIEKVGDMILIADADGRIGYVSPAATSVLGYDPDALTGMNLMELLHPDDVTRAVEALQRGVAKPGSSVDLEVRARHRDGNWRIMAVNGRSLLDQPGIEGILITAHDDTERRLALEEAQNAQTNLSDALESISSGIALFDSDGRLVIHNRNYLALNDEIADLVEPGAEITDLIRARVERGMIASSSDEDGQATIARQLAAFHDPGDEPLESQLHDGRVVRIRLRSAKGGGTVSVADDITAERRAERQLHEAQRMEAIGKLTGGMAHDFNNYLGIIIGNLDLLSEGTDSPEDAKRRIQAALTAGERAAELTRSLLAFSRRQPLDPRIIDANGHIAEITKLLNRTIGEDVEVVLDLADELWPVTVDVSQLESCVLNLANNARDAMPSGGVLRIATANRTLHPDLLDTDNETPAGDYTMIEISDTGTGMSAETVERAFEPFFTTKAMGNGTGLGLSMVYGFVKQSGGDVRLYSEPGHGTTVRLYLPRTAQPTEAAPRPRAAADLPTGTETILIVEDNEELRATVMAQLAPLGYRLVEAADGDAALAILEAREPAIDLLFTDVVMPGQINGKDLARIVGRLWPQVRVLLTSGFPGDVVEGEADDPKLPPILGKPYHRRDLAIAIRSMLETGRLPGDGAA